MEGILITGLGRLCLGITDEGVMMNERPLKNFCRRSGGWGGVQGVRQTSTWLHSNSFEQYRSFVLF